MNWPDKLDEEDFVLFLKECQLLGAQFWTKEHPFEPVSIAYVEREGLRSVAIAPADEPHAWYDYAKGCWHLWT